MTVKANVSGSYSVKFSARVWFVTINKTETGSVNENVDLGTLESSALNRTIPLDGPADVVLSVVPNAAGTGFTASVSLQVLGLTVYSHSLALGATSPAPWVITIKDLHGVTAKITTTFTVSN